MGLNVGHSTVRQRLELRAAPRFSTTHTFSLNCIHLLVSSVFLGIEFCIRFGQTLMDLSLQACPAEGIGQVADMRLSTSPAPLEFAGEII